MIKEILISGCLFFGAAAGGAVIPSVQVVPSSPSGPQFIVDGKVMPATIYYANNQYDRDELALEGIQKAYDQGFRVISIQLLLPGVASPEDIVKTMDKFLKPFPDALFLPRVWMGVSGKWYQENQDQLYTFATGEKVKDIASPVSEKWLSETTAGLEQLLDIITSSEYAGRFIGVIPLYYYTGEWHMWELDKSGGYSPLMETAFQQWAEQKYQTIKNLNTAWRTSYRRFDVIKLPTEEERNQAVFGFFRDPSRQQREIDFALFFNTRSPELMIPLAKTVKEKTQNRSLVGYFYGYHFEHAWHDTWPQQSGHLGLSKILNSPFIDFYGCSYSYSFFNRKFGYPVDYISPHDSALLNGKAVFFEEDSYTHLAIPPEMDWAPGWQHRTTTIDETMALLKRNMGVVIAHGEIMHWQDLLSDGRFNDVRVWQWYNEAFAFQQTLKTDVPYQPQVAVVLDETYSVWQKVKSRAVFGRWVYETRMALTRVDTTFGWYLQTDLDKIPESVRCVILLTPYHISPAQKTALQTRFMKDGRMVVFCYLPDMFREGESPALTGFAGIDLKLHHTAVNPESKLVPNTLLTGDYPLVLGDNRDLSYIENHPNAKLPDINPYLSVNDRHAAVFAKYAATGEASCAWKTMDGWTSVYLGTSRLSAAVWRALFAKAGCHLYLNEISDDFKAPDFIQASGNFLMVQSFAGGRKTIQLPAEADKIFLWNDGEHQLIGTDTTAVEIQLKPGIPEYIYFGEKK